MIRGIGIDVCQISRIKNDLSKRILSDKEMKIFNEITDASKKSEYLASRFSVKEAILKALTGVKTEIYMRSIVILNDENGRPYVENPKFDDIKIWISISHERDYCVCQAIIENV